MKTRSVLTEFLNYLAEENFRLKMMGPERFIEEFIKKHPSVEIDYDQYERWFKEFKKKYDELQEKCDVRKLNWFQKILLRNVIGWRF